MQRLVAAFFNSVAGLRFGIGNEPAIRQEMALLALAVPVAPFLSLDPWKLVAMWASLLLLLSVELLNTGIEKLADRVTGDHDPLVRIAKDCGSAAVLMAIAVACLVWGVAFWQRMFA